MTSWALPWIIAACCCLQGNTVPFHARSESEVGDYNDYSEDNTSDETDSLFETIHDTYTKFKSKDLESKKDVRIDGSLDSNAESSSWLDEESSEDIGPSIEIPGSNENADINYNINYYNSKNDNKRDDSKKLASRFHVDEAPQDNSDHLHNQSFFENYTNSALNEDITSMSSKTKMKRMNSVHIGEDITLCWIETVTVKEDNSSEPPRRQISKDYTISFENSAPIPEEYLDCSYINGEVAAHGECAVIKSASNEHIDKDTKISKVINSTTKSHEGKFLITKHKSVRCAIGPIVTKDVYEQFDDPKKPKRRVEIRVGSLKENFEAQGDTIKPSLPDHSTGIDTSSFPSIAPSNKTAPPTECSGKNCQLNQPSKGIPTPGIPNEHDTGEKFPGGIGSTSTTPKPNKNDSRGPNTSATESPGDDSSESMSSEQSHPLINAENSKEKSPEDDLSAPDNSKNGVSKDSSSGSESSEKMPPKIEKIPVKSKLPTSDPKAVTPAVHEGNVTKNINNEIKSGDIDSNPSSDNGNVSSDGITSSGESCEDSEDCSDTSETTEFGEKHIIDDFLNQTSECNDTSEECQSLEPSGEISKSLPNEKLSHNTGLKENQINCTDADPKKCNHSSTSTMIKPRPISNSSDAVTNNSSRLKPTHSTIPGKQTPESSSADLDKIPSGNSTKDQQKASMETIPPTPSIQSSNVTSTFSIGTSRSIPMNNSVVTSPTIIPGATLDPESISEEDLADLENETTPSTFSEDMDDTISLAADDLLKHITSDESDEQKNVTVSSWGRSIECSDSDKCPKPTNLPLENSTESEDYSLSDSSYGDNESNESGNPKSDNDPDCEGDADCLSVSSSDSCDGDCSGTTKSLEKLSKVPISELTSETKLSSTMATPVGNGKTIILDIGNISTTAKTRSSLPTESFPSMKNEKSGKRRLALKIKVLLEQINDNKEKHPLVQVEKQVTLNEDEDQRGNRSLLWKIKALNNSGDDIQYVKDFLNCSTLDNFTDISHEIIEDLKNELKQHEPDSENETQVIHRRKRNSESVVEAKKNISLKADDVKRCLPLIHGGIKTGLNRILSEISSNLNISKNGTIGNTNQVSISIDDSESEKTTNLLQHVTDISRDVGNASNSDADELVRKWSKERVSRLLDGGQLRSAIELTILHENEGSHHDT